MDIIEITLQSRNESTTQKQDRENPKAMLKQS